MNKKIYIQGLLPVLAAVCLIAGIFAAMNRAGYESVYLNDTESSRNGWEYEIRTDSGEVKKVIPQFMDEYSYTLSDEKYNAVKESRIMTESLTGMSLETDYAQCGIEVFLDGCLLYSDFQMTLRDAHGYLLVDEADIREELRSIAVGLPEDYTGRKLTIITYFAPNADFRYPVVPCLGNDDTAISEAFAGTVPQTLWLVFCGCMVLTVAVCCLFPVSDKILRFKMAALFVVYVVSFVMSACNSVIGYYSGMWEAVYGIFEKFSFSMETAELVLLADCAAALLAAEIATGRKKREKNLFRQIMLFGVMGFVITALQNSSELAGGMGSYFPTVLLSIAGNNFVPVLKLCSSLMIYTVTFLTISQFAVWSIQEWKKQSLLLERSRFARENYELVMQVDEDSRRRNHEIRHHLQTLYSMLMGQEPDGAKKYIEKVIKESDQYTEMTYSENIVLNSIVGIRLNQAKKNGIDVQCHIHVPCKLEADDVDLSILLSNMLENAVEACMRMENREGAYIRLDIRKKQKFLFIECENGIDIKDVPKSGQTTVKDDRKNHGFGLDAMKSVAEKYASIIQIEYVPGRFTVRTNLCLPE
ncbi:MAG TPA: hypothetical protein DCR27_05270 [Lachnospiraceae bacterium]|nr:hypothetical protein [Lachnospiraceae bacterium]